MNRLDNLCKKYNRPMPTEIKMVYDIKSKQFNADYKYEPVYSNHKTKTADTIADEWFMSIKNNN